MQTMRVPVGRVPQIKHTCEGRKIPFRPPNLGNIALPYTLGQGQKFLVECGKNLVEYGKNVRTPLIYSFHSYFKIKVSIRYFNLV
jgi:hypothetical protein